jgi:hypothetical protein
MSNTLVDVYKLEMDGKKELNVVVKRPGTLAEAASFGHFVEGVSLDPLMRTEYDMLSNFTPKIKGELITPRYFGVYRNEPAGQIALGSYPGKGTHESKRTGKTSNFFFRASRYLTLAIFHICVVMEHITSRKGDTDALWTEEVFQMVLRRLARHHATFWQNTHKDHPQFAPDAKLLSMVHAYVFSDNQTFFGLSAQLRLIFV